ncbi:MAG: ECF-type sigma factor [Candidatus Polarisedimenticolia bacterium]
MDTDLVGLFKAVEQGDGAAGEALFSRLYAELRRVARRELARSGFPISLGATTLLHEAYLDMAAREGPAFPDRPRFLAYTARVMRGLIIDHARERRAVKRGGAFEITSLPTDVEANVANDRELERIGEALDQLAKVDRSLAEIVDLKFFCGFSFAEVAAVHGVTERTVQRRWERARIYLHRTLRTDLPES